MLTNKQAEFIAEKCDEYLAAPLSQRKKLQAKMIRRLCVLQDAVSLKRDARILREVIGMISDPTIKRIQSNLVNPKGQYWAFQKGTNLGSSPNCEWLSLLTRKVTARVITTTQADNEQTRPERILGKVYSLAGMFSTCAKEASRMISAKTLKYVYNLPPKVAEAAKTIFDNREDDEWLMELFDWKKTPEGFNHWAALANSPTETEFALNLYRKLEAMCVTQDQLSQVSKYRVSQIPIKKREHTRPLGGRQDHYHYGGRPQAFNPAPNPYYGGVTTTTAAADEVPTANDMYLRAARTIREQGRATIGVRAVQGGDTTRH